MTRFKHLYVLYKDQTSLEIESIPGTYNGFKIVGGILFIEYHAKTDENEKSVKRVHKFINFSEVKEVEIEKD